MHINCYNRVLHKKCATLHTSRNDSHFDNILIRISKKRRRKQLGPDGLRHETRVEPEEGGVKETRDVTWHLLRFLQAGLDLLRQGRRIGQLVVICDLHQARGATTKLIHDRQQAGSARTKTNLWSTAE